MPAKKSKLTVGSWTVSAGEGRKGGIGIIIIVQWDTVCMDITYGKTFFTVHFFTVSKTNIHMDHYCMGYIHISILHIIWDNII